MKVEILEVAGLVPAMQALRLPYGKKPRSSNEYRPTFPAEGEIFEHEAEFTRGVFHFERINKEDIALAQKLIKAGDEHGKILRGCIVYMKITAPLYFWNEATTYRVGCECLSSTSSMHTLGKRDISIHDFEIKDIIKEMLTPTPKYKVQALRVDAPSELLSKTFYYNGREYEVWNNGDIYSMPFDITYTNKSGKTISSHYDKKLIKPSLKPDGYYSVRMGGRDGGNIQYHRVLAMCFVPNPDNKPQVNHKDGNRANCSIDNLEWMTAAENTQHSIKVLGKNTAPVRVGYLKHKDGMKYTKDVVDEIKKMRSQGMTLREIADIYNTCETTISQQCTGACLRVSSPLRMEYEEAESWEQTISRLNELAEDYRESNSDEAFISLKRLLPSAFLQTRIFAISYQTLRRIWKQRRNHRLPEWHTFIEACRQLPFANELIFVE